MNTVAKQRIDRASSSSRLGTFEPHATIDTQHGVRNGDDGNAMEDTRDYSQEDLGGWRGRRPDAKREKLAKVPSQECAGMQSSLEILRRHSRH